jgi:predicted ATPase
MNRLSRLSLTGFKSIRAMDLELGELNVLIGPNGAGKSNLLSFFRMLSALAEGRLSRFIEAEGGAPFILHHGRKHTSEITMAVSFVEGEREITYRVTLGAAPPATFFLDGEEIVWSPTPGTSETHAYGGRKAVALSSFSHPHGREDEEVLARLVGGLTHYHFHDTSAKADIRQPWLIDENRVLREDGGNLVAFLYRLRRTDPARYEGIRDTIRLAVPFFDDFVLEPNAANPRTILLAWRERGSDMLFFAHHLSDGALRFIALTTALLQSELPVIIALDEPELGLHPYAVTLLAAMIRSASKSRQVIVATQSVTLLDALAEPEDVIIVQRETSESGLSETRFRRRPPAELSAWLVEYTLGELWEKNVLGGRP